MVGKIRSISKSSNRTCGCTPSHEVVRGRGLNVRIAALSTMLRIVNLFIALSLGVHLEQFEQRMGFTWPRPFLLRPLQYECQPLLSPFEGAKAYFDARFLTIFAILSEFQRICMIGLVENCLPFDFRCRDAAVTDTGSSLSHLAWAR